MWFITPQREIIFQHRAKNKDTYPDKLDATVGGHVDLGMSYLDTALREVQEETGIVIESADLKLIKKIRRNDVDTSTGMINNRFSNQYAYLYEGTLDDLQVEEGKALGFEAWNSDDLSRLSKEDKERFIPLIVTKEYLDLYEEAQKVLGLL